MTKPSEREDKFLGLFMGMAVGDALGAPLEFQDAREPKDYLKRYATGGVHDVSVGEFTDDTSMALAIADAFIKKQKFDPTQIMKNFLNWKNDGAYAPRGIMFDCGMTVLKALNKFEKDKSNPFTGDTDQFSAGNGGLMRLAPSILFSKNEDEAAWLAKETTRLTHGAEEALMFSEIFARELWQGAAIDDGNPHRLDTNTPRNKVLSGGYVKETYQVSWWSVQSTDNFEDAVIKAINRGHDSDTSGAVTGMLAGRIYGLSKIPEWMVENLQWNTELLSVAGSLISLANGK